MTTCEELSSPLEVTLLRKSLPAKAAFLFDVLGELSPSLEVEVKSCSSQALASL